MVKIINNNITIRSAMDSDFDNIFKLSERKFGTGYLNKDEFNEWLGVGDLFLVAEFEGHFAGYACLLPSNAREVSDYMKLDYDAVLSFSGSDKILHCRSAAMHDDYQGKGIMHIMLSNILEVGRVSGFSAAFAPAWKYNNHIPMLHVMEHLGFEFYSESENVWYNDSNYTCIVCKGRCKCTAAIFRKKL